jgi:2-amino-4-hydroxy-6-hydroxymethyldihydropteridine diphosphokinase
LKQAALKEVMMIERSCQAYIALGSNKEFNGLASKDIIVRAAKAVFDFAAWGEEGEICSSLYRSLAWLDPSDPPFVNAVMRIKTGLAPQALMAGLLAIEAGFGRDRQDQLKNAPRSLDLDLLAMGDLVIRGENEEALTLPHPRLSERAFVLVPLAEIAPDWRHPQSSIEIEDLLARLQQGATPLKDWPEKL